MTRVRTWRRGRRSPGRRAARGVTVWSAALGVSVLVALAAVQLPADAPARPAGGGRLAFGVLGGSCAADRAAALRDAGENVVMMPAAS